MFFPVFGSHKWPIVIKIESQRMGQIYPFLRHQSFVCELLFAMIARVELQLIPIDYAYSGVVFVFCFVFFCCIESSSVSICQQVFLSRKREVVPHHQKARRRCFLLLYTSAQLYLSVKREEHVFCPV